MPSERGNVNAKPLAAREKPPRGGPILSVCNVHKLFGALAANRDIGLADYAYVLESSAIVLEAPAAEVANHSSVINAYLGV